MADGVRKNRRDALDMAGKVVLALKALSVGISADMLIIDPAQAGGLMGKSDGAVVDRNGLQQMHEIKGSRCKKGKPTTFTLKDIRVKGTTFLHILGVLRIQDPVDWTDVDEYSKCGFWLAHITRGNLLEAMAESGRGHLDKVDATITPGSKASWLGKYVSWVKFDDLTLQWWNDHVSS